MSNSISSVAFKLAYQLSPIILTGGIAEGVGGILPIIVITEAANFVKDLLQGSLDVNLDEYFANFAPLAGATLIEQEIAHYPFANQAVAGNATISQPLHFSLSMTCPARGSFGLLAKSATMTLLQYTLARHNAQGGLYTVLTPSFMYTSCILKSLHDISSGETKQPQVTWQFDFEKPLVTQNQAAGALCSLMNKISSGSQIDGVPSWSGSGAQSVGGTSPTNVMTPTGDFNPSASGSDIA